MENNNNLGVFDEQVDRFLRQQMSTHEECAFKQRLAENPELKQRARAIALMIQEMQEVQGKKDRRIINTIKGLSGGEFFEVAFEPTVDIESSEVEENDVSAIKNRFWFRFVSYAAAACVLGFIIYSCFGKFKSYDGGEAYAGACEEPCVYDVVEDEYDNGCKYNLKEIVMRLGSNSYADYDLSLSERSIGERDVVILLRRLFDDVRLGENLDRAIHQLEPKYKRAAAGDIEYATFKDDIAWNLAIAYLKIGDVNKPIPLLESIVESKRDDREKALPAIQLIEKIKSLY